MNRDERVNGRFPYNIQAKNTTNHLKYGKVMAEMATTPGIINVILHKQTEKKKWNKVYMGQVCHFKNG